MSTLSSRYGSELHLLRYLGRHRTDFDRRILVETGGQAIRWLDFSFDQTPSAERRPNQNWDVELKGLEFLGDEPEARVKWAQFWPQTPSTITWDAVGRIEYGDRSEWLLLEAKAHTDELVQSCKARGRGRKQITDALAAAKSSLRVPAEADWLTTYYQFCNRVAALYFLTELNVPARLLFVYFYGDDYPGKDCPQRPEDWHERLSSLEHYVGLPADHPLASRIHKVFVPVRRLE
jgi:hypothetical protein